MTRDRLVPTLRKGTVTAVSATTVDVDVEESGVDATMGWVCDGRPMVGDVVSCLWAFGTGVVLGPLSIDVWHTVDGPGEPAFATNWANIAGSRSTGFRRIGDRVELCGAAEWLGAAVVQPISIFTLPVGYRPDALLRYTMSANLSGGGNSQACTVLVNTSGLVQLTHWGGSVDWGSVGFEGMSFPLIGAT